MQPLGYVLQNSCSTPLLKKQLNHAYEKLNRGIFYNRSRATVLRLDSEGSWSLEVPGGPRVQRSWGSRGSMGSWGTGGPEFPLSQGSWRSRRSQGSQESSRSQGFWRFQDRVPLFYHAPYLLVMMRVFALYSFWMTFQREKSFTLRK